MRVVILTTSLFGAAGHHLPVIATAKGIEIAAVVVSEGVTANRRKKYLRTVRKISKIGILGALNGMRMRKWYGENLDQYNEVKSVAETCRELNIRFERVPSTNSALTRQLFSELNSDIALSLGNGYISPKVFRIPKFGMLNIHHELLPDYQNAQSVIWQIFNGSAETGYTIHKINDHIDTGDILAQRRVPIRFKATLAETVTATLAEVFNQSAVGLKDVLENFELYYSNAQPQGKGKKYTTPSYAQYLRILRNFKLLKSKNSTSA